MEEGSLAPVEDALRDQRGETGGQATAAEVGMRAHRADLGRARRAETLAGLSGLGDLVLTCTSTNSRNFSLGKGLGQGIPAEDLLRDRHTVAEGASTAPVLAEAARAAGIDMPIVDSVCALLSGAAMVDDVVRSLLARPLKQEDL